MHFSQDEKTKYHLVHVPRLLETRKETHDVCLEFCLPISKCKKKASKGSMNKHALSHTGSHHVFFDKLSTHTVKSINNRQLSSKQDLAAQSHCSTGEEMICGRSMSDFRAEELSSEKCCPSFNSATKPKQKPHQFSLITPCCCTGSTYRQFIYHKSQSAFYAGRRCFALLATLRACRMATYCIHLTL